MADGTPVEKALAGAAADLARAGKRFALVGGLAHLDLERVRQNLFI